MPDALAPLPEHLIPKLASAMLTDALPANVREYSHGVAECVGCGVLTLYTWACPSCWSFVDPTPPLPVRYRV